MFVGMLLLCGGGLCLEFMMFANIVVTFVDSVVLFAFLGWIKNHLKKGKRNRVGRERMRKRERERGGKKERKRRKCAPNILFALIKEHYRAMQIDKGVLWAYAKRWSSSLSLLYSGARSSTQTTAQHTHLCSAISHRREKKLKEYNKRKNRNVTLDSDQQ